jgi:hypothetical protein
MIGSARYYCIVIAALVFAASPTYAGPCSHAIISVQTQVDAAIEFRVCSAGWRAEDLNTPGYQPARHSLPASVGGNGELFEYALDALDRARAADRDADSATCHQQLVNARAALAQ